MVGLFPDILENISSKEGWHIEWIPGTWSQCLQRLEKGEIDLMVDVAFSEERAELYNFTKETMLVNWAVIYTGATVTVQSLMDLSGKKIAVMKGSIHTEGMGGIKQLIEKFDIDCQFIEVDSYNKVFDLVSKSDADVGVVNRVFGSLFSESFNVHETSIIFNPRHLRFACSKESAIGPALLEKLDQHLINLRKDPDSIYHKAISVYLSGLPRELIFLEEKEYPSEKKISLTPAEDLWISNHPNIRLGIDPEFAPFEYVSPKGNYEGITSDYIQLLNERLGINMEVIQKDSWIEAVTKAKTKEIDVLPCVGITQERTNFMIFSKPYINFYRVIISRTDQPFLSNMRDIEGMKVAVQANSSHEGYLKDNTGIKPILYPKLQDSLLAVSNGQADVFIGNLTSSTFWIRKLNLTNLKVAASVSEETQKLHFAVRDDWPELVGILNKGLASISPDEINQIQTKWVNIEYTPGINSRDFWRYVYQISGVMIILFIVVILWNYKLKKEIQKRIEIENQLSVANKNLKTLDRMKSMFIASMSHELRTPLNSIIGFTGIIIQEMTGPLNDKQKDHLSRVYNSAKHLLSLISDVIDISKIEAGRVDIFSQEFFLSEVVDEALINIQPQLKEKKMILETSIPEKLLMKSDRKRLLQCIINYMSNAVKYTESG
ncbi:MAG: transporter substrate-binding domain-containing protein [Spirochaetales bacterium]|nr:transporter substrate-binding domain-containing protein [Spirochaetales bacterium]